MKPGFAPALAGVDARTGLPCLPSGAFLELEAPGWTRGIGTGGRVWPSAAALCRYLSRSDVARDKRVLELGCGTGAVGCFAAGVGAASVVLTEGGTDGLRRLASRNVDANRHLFAPGARAVVAKHSWGDDVDDAWIPDLVLGSDVTYDRDAHDRLCRTVRALLLRTPGCVALLAHQHRRLASFVGGASQLDHFLKAAAKVDLDVATAHVDETNALSPVTVLRVHASAWHGPTSKVRV